MKKVVVAIVAICFIVGLIWAMQSKGVQKPTESPVLASEVKLPSVNGKQPTLDGIRDFGLTTARGWDLSFWRGEFESPSLDGFDVFLDGFEVFKDGKRFKQRYKLDYEDTKVEPVAGRENVWKVEGRIRYEEQSDNIGETWTAWTVLVTMAEPSDSKTYRSLDWWLEHRNRSSTLTSWKLNIIGEESSVDAQTKP